MVESSPLVSVIMATYNSQGYVRESVESVLAQTECDWGLRITDDCSVDSTFVLLQAFEAQDSRDSRSAPRFESRSCSSPEQVHRESKWTIHRVSRQ